ncbi:MAG: hypothetical protein CM1200mP36_00280 [Gammaproteobacteria bacterium]|nr:MAG: hypothetical protein CM1200mP36_00280 [Gammaproteobacteria bacterium]
MTQARYQGSQGLYSHLQQQRRLWNFFGETEDPKVHEWLLAMQRRVLSHLLHPRVMTRVTDSRLYGNEYELADFYGRPNDGNLRRRACAVT